MALFSEITDLIIWINPLVSATKMPPFTAKFFEIEQLVQETSELSFEQNIPPSDAELLKNLELKISVFEF